jgi:hypothetical protein
MEYQKQIMIMPGTESGYDVAGYIYSELTNSKHGIEWIIDEELLECLGQIDIETMDSNPNWCLDIIDQTILSAFGHVPTHSESNAAHGDWGLYIDSNLSIWACKKSYGHGNPAYEGNRFRDMSDFREE